MTGDSMLEDDKNEHDEFDEFAEDDTFSDDSFEGDLDDDEDDDSDETSPETEASSDEDSPAEALDDDEDEDEDDAFADPLADSLADDDDLDGLDDDDDEDAFEERELDDTGGTFVDFTSGISEQDPKTLAMYFGGGIVALFLVWQVLGALFGGGDDEIPPIEPIAQVDEAPVEPMVSPDLMIEPEIAFVPEPEPEPEPEIIIKEVEVPAEVDLNPVNQRLSGLKNDLDDISQHVLSVNETLNTRLRRIESGMRGVTDDLDDMNRYLGHVSEQVTQVTGQVQTMSDQFKILGSSMDADRRNLASEIDYANPSLHVHAVIPGRAWLKQADGSILTVIEGDNLGDYGKVLAIDAPAGAVVTSSGITLR